MWNSVTKKFRLRVRHEFGGEQGVLTLEAAVILPFFLGLILAVINFMHVSMVYLAMDHALSQAVRQFTLQAGPVKMVEMAGEILGPVRPAAAGIIDGTLEALARETVRSGLKSFYPLGKLEDGDFTVSGPAGGTGGADTSILIDDGSGPVLAVTVTYRVKIRVPFFAGEIPLTNSVVERCWTF